MRNHASKSARKHTSREAKQQRRKLQRFLQLNKEECKKAKRRKASTIEKSKANFDSLALLFSNVLAFLLFPFNEANKQIVIMRATKKGKRKPVNCKTD